eukprot:scpid61813/ scgid21950/ Pleckstrin homology domain-containing family A member 2; Tandem PH domain-containing protein 2
MSTAEGQQSKDGTATKGAATGQGLPLGQEGYLDKESKNSKWNRRYFVLEHACLRYYKDKPANLPEEERQSRGEIRLKRVLGVDTTTVKDHRSCLEIQTIGGPIYLAAYSDEERSKWIDQIRLACRRLTMQSSASTDPVMQHGVESLSLQDRSSCSATAPSKTDTTSGTKTHVVAGVVVRLPMKSDGDGSAPPERTSDTDVSHPDRVMSLGSSTLGANAPPQQGMSSATSGSSLGVGHRREGGRVVKSGYCVKQGHVRKNWKKRFFLLDPFGFAYYSSETDKEPIRNIAITEILAVNECTSFSSRGNVFQLVTNGCIYYIQAPTERDMREWIAAVQGELHGVTKSPEKGNRRSLRM